MNGFKGESFRIYKWALVLPTGIYAMSHNAFPH
jgi:hypothetical protein